MRRVSEAELGPELAERLTALLRDCFPGYPDRPYFKLPPHERIVAFDRGDLVGQAGLEHRVVRVGGRVVRTLGIVDLCVPEGHRSRGLGAALVEEAGERASAVGADFVLLFADRHDLYLRCGFALVDNPCTWVKIDEHRTLGIAPPTSLADCLMVRQVGDLAWPAGDVDLLGHVF